MMILCPKKSRKSPLVSPFSFAARTIQNKTKKRAHFGFNKYNHENHSSNNKIVFSENGTKITTRGLAGTYQTIVSTQGFNKGVKIWRIEAVFLHCGHGMGICTETSTSPQPGCVEITRVKGLGLVYAYKKSMQGIQRGRNGKVENVYCKNQGLWESGKTITILLDCNKWQVVFWLNEKRLHEPIDIEKNITYYPLVNCCTCSDSPNLKLIVC